MAKVLTTYKNHFRMKPRSGICIAEEEDVATIGHNYGHVIVMENLAENMMKYRECTGRPDS